MTKGDSTEKDVSERMETLTEAFHQFSEETKRLEKAYQLLEEKFRSVSRQLEETDHRLQKKIVELDLVTHYLQNIVTHIQEGILFIGQNGLISICNEAAEKILGVKQKTILFQNFWKFFSNDFLGFSLEEALKHHAAPSLVHLTHKEKELEVSISFVSEGSQEHQGVVLLFRDITEIRKLQMRTHLDDRMKELGEMAASVAHEIRNPLGGILGFASLLRRSLEGQEEHIEKIDTIIEGTKTLNQLVEDVLHYARPVKLKLIRKDLKKVVQKLTTLLKADPRTPKNITIVTHFPKNPLMIDLDENLLLSTLLNLAINAFQAMPNGGTLTLTLREEEQFASLEVNDTGEGIEQENLMKIFSPFFTTKEKGIGLGLSESYKIIQGHFGKIEVSSTVSVGTTFSISLPRGAL